MSDRVEILKAWAVLLLGGAASVGLILWAVLR
jgi:hypothetical protein